MSRVNPLDDLGDLTDFTPKPRGDSNKVTPEVIERLSTENNFPSRQPAPHAKARSRKDRRRTGRTEQINIKTTAEAIDQFIQIGEPRRWTNGETFERALAALLRELEAE